SPVPRMGLRRDSGDRPLTRPPRIQPVLRRQHSARRLDINGIRNQGLDHVVHIHESNPTCDEGEPILLTDLLTDGSSEGGISRKKLADRFRESLGRRYFPAWSVTS